MVESENHARVKKINKSHIQDRRQIGKRKYNEREKHK